MKKKNQLKVSKATVYKKTLYYIPEADRASENPTLITCTTLSYRQLVNLNFFIENNLISELFLETVKQSVTNISNIVINGALESSEDYSILPYDLVKEVATFILDSSKIDSSDPEKLANMYDIVNDDRFKSPTYNCSECQRRGLDKLRNCGKLGEQTKDPNFYLMVGDTKFTYCPIFIVDTEYLSEALTCYKYYSDGLLPEPGGLYDQTEFFLTTSSILSTKVKESEAKYYEDMKNKRK